MTTDSFPSSSEAKSSEAFGQLHPLIQKWVWDQGWTQLRSAQIDAAIPVLSESCDVIISAATASGKTEAAFLPICSRLAGQPGKPGIAVLYVSPLKALINDQTERLEQLCARVDVPVNRWHGDVSGSVKTRLIRNPQGVLLITPESLEALLVRRGTVIAPMFAGLRYVVVDELHAFLGNARGHQLQSLLHRVELAVRRRVPRVGLSATLSDLSSAAAFLRPENPDKVVAVRSSDDTQELRLQMLAFTASARPNDEQEHGNGSKISNSRAITDTRAIAQHLLSRLRGSHNLVFANTRQRVEELADLLNHLSTEQHMTNEFLPHHGNLSKDVREDVEARLNDSNRPVTAICTSTLELGIDIGSMQSVAQVGAPPSVSSLRQRLGRSGRRGEAAVLRIYVSEPEISQGTAPLDALRPELVKSIAIVKLLQAHWYEPPQIGELDYSTLVQQILALIAQHGGVTAADAYRVLCGPGPFAGVTSERFMVLLRNMGALDLIVQMEDSTLLHGVAGERIVNHYEFYTAFVTPQEYRLIANGRTIGTLPIESPLFEGAFVIFAGRRWRVETVNSQQRVIELAQASGGVPPAFGGSGMLVDARVHQEMLAVYKDSDIPRYLDAGARRFLAEGRDNFARFDLARKPLLDWGEDTVLFHWSGDRVGTTLVVALAQRKIRATAEGFAITATKTSVCELKSHLQQLRDEPAPAPCELASTVETKRDAKYDWVLGPQLLDEAYASRSLDIEATWRMLNASVTGGPEVLDERGG